MTWAPAFDVRFYLALALVLAGLMVLAQRFALVATAQGSVLYLLRIAVLSIVVFILLDPIRIDKVRRPGPLPTAVYLFDSSRSMSLETPLSRAQVVEEFLRRADELLTPDRRPRIQSYRFGRALDAISDGSIVQVPRPKEDETRLVSALRELPSRFDNPSPLGVVVFSDGRTMETEGIEPLAQFYRTLGVPIHVVPVGDQQASGDVALQMIDAPRNAAPGTKLPVRVSLRSHGYDGARLELKIRRADDAQARPVASLPITLTGGEQSHELVIETDQAKGSLVLEAPVLPRESIAANNIVTFEISPRPQKIRAIYLEGGSPNAYRRLSEALAEDPEIQCLDIGTTFRGSRGAGLVRKKDPRLGFPSNRAELFEYDVIICSDIARGSFTPDQLKWTVELVSERGGGFAMVGGNNSYGAGQYHTTVWNGLIPVDMGEWGLERGFSNIIYWGQNKIFRVVVPAEAQGHPIWHFSDDSERNRAILEKMPIFYGCNLVERLKPGATILGRSDRALLSVGKAPIFSCQSFGRGRTFAMLTDTTPDWGRDFESSWGEPGDNRYFRRFWRNVVRWLGENSAGTNRRLQVDVDKVIYRPGQPIRIIARTFDEQARTVDSYRIRARLQLADPAAEPNANVPGNSSRETAKAVELTSVDLAPSLNDHVYRGELTAPTAGTVLEDPGSTLQQLILEIEAFDGDRQVASTRLGLRLLDDPAEFVDPRPDADRLIQLANATGGQVLRSPQGLVELLTTQGRAGDRILTYQTPLWDNAWIWALLLGLLAAEWIVRRSRGLA
jgi:uncharacterized membrane protein